WKCVLGLDRLTARNHRRVVNIRSDALHQPGAMFPADVWKRRFKLFCDVPTALPFAQVGVHEYRALDVEIDQAPAFVLREGLVGFPTPHHISGTMPGNGSVAEFYSGRCHRITLRGIGPN